MTPHTAERRKRCRTQEITDSVARLRKIRVMPLKSFLADQGSKDLAGSRLQATSEAAPRHGRPLCR